MLKVIFACVHNAGRSQMAAAFFNQLADRSKAEAISAGTDPGPRVHPEVLAAMQEIGIDLSNAKPQKLTEDLARQAQLLITMGCGDNCPYVPGLRRDDWPLRDPKGQPMEEVRKIRDKIRAACNRFLLRKASPLPREANPTLPAAVAPAPIARRDTRCDPQPEAPRAKSSARPHAESSRTDPSSRPRPARPSPSNPP